MVWLLVIFVYLFGFFFFVVLFSCWFGIQDLCVSGFGNFGVINMLCVVGKKFVILILFGDVGKGLLLVLVVCWLGFGVMEEVWVGIVVVIGYLYLLYFNFCGGKGVVIVVGMFFGFYLLVVLLVVVVWLLIFKLLCISLFVLLVVILLILLLLVWQQFGVLLLMIVLIGLIVWWYCVNLCDLFVGCEWYF